MAYSEQSTGDTELDKLLTAHHNAVFDCGDYRDPGEDPCYDDDRPHLKYESAFQKAEATRVALYNALRNRLGMGKESAPR